MTNKYYCIYTLKLAQKLGREGFPIQKTGINPVKPWLNVFYFEDSPKFRDALTQLTADK